MRLDEFPNFLRGYLDQEIKNYTRRVLAKVEVLDGEVMFNQEGLWPLALRRELAANFLQIMEEYDKLNKHNHASALPTEANETSTNVSKAEHQ